MYKENIRADSPPISAFVAIATSGFLFGLGLAISGMTNPAKVVGFLDIAGDWDPSLILGMVAGLGGLKARRGRANAKDAPKEAPPSKGKGSSSLFLILLSSWGLI